MGSDRGMSRPVRRRLRWGMVIAAVLYLGFHYSSKWLYVKFTNDQAGAEDAALIATGAASVLVIIGLIVFYYRKSKKDNNKSSQ